MALSSTISSSRVPYLANSVRLEAVARAFKTTLIPIMPEVLASAAGFEFPVGFSSLQAPMARTAARQSIIRRVMDELPWVGGLWRNERCEGENGVGGRRRRQR